MKQGIEVHQDNLQKLHELLLSTLAEEKKEDAKRESSLDEKSAAVIIQRTWRLSKILKQLVEDSYQISSLGWW